METFARIAERDSFLEEPLLRSEGMARRVIGQLGLMDAALSRRGGSGEDGLSALSSLVDWSRFATLLNGIHAAKKGEASYPPLMMFKVLLLQRWHGLSDPAMEAALSDRLSFMRFAGMSLEDASPDHTTIWRFRQALGAEGLLERLLGELNRQLDAHGLLVKQGTLIDASVVTSAARRPRMEEDKVSATDPEARFGTTNERRRFSFGYKLHVAVDAGSGLVRALQVTPANVQEVTVAPALLAHADGLVLGDRGYDSDPLRAQVNARGLEDGLMRRRRGRDLTPAEVARNHALSLQRRAVESLFGTMKRSYGLGRMRAFTLLRNAIDLTLFAIAFNLRRWRVLATG
jgi:IS5 family transposase